MTVGLHTLRWTTGNGMITKWEASGREWPQSFQPINLPYAQYQDPLSATLAMLTSFLQGDIRFCFALTVSSRVPTDAHILLHLASGLRETWFLKLQSSAFIRREFSSILLRNSNLLKSEPHSTCSSNKNSQIVRKQSPLQIATTAQVQVVRPEARNHAKKCSEQKSRKIFRWLS